MKCVSSSTSIALLLVVASAIQTTQALKSYLSNLPNGALFTQPLGHPDSDETQFTDFATAFAAVDKTWTTAFCKDTFPGSTMTNGAAFGDPCCTWKKGDTAPQTVTAFTTTPTKATTCTTDATPAPAVTTATPAATEAPETDEPETEAPETETPETEAPETEAPATLTSAPAASSEGGSSSSTTTSAPAASSASSAKPSSNSGGGGSAYSPGKVSPPNGQKGQSSDKRPTHRHGGQSGAQAFGARGGNNSTASSAAGAGGKGQGMGFGKQHKFGRGSGGSAMKPAASQTPTAAN